MQPSSLKYHNTLAQYYNNQPLWFDDKMEKPNARKCMELPWQHAMLDNWDEVTDTLCDIIFIEANAKANLFSSLKTLFEFALSQTQHSKKDDNIALFYFVFIRHLSTLKEYPELTFQQLFNELQWLNNDVSNTLKNNKDTYIANGGYFLHQYRLPKKINSYLRFNLTNHNGSVNIVQFSPDGKRFVSASSDATIKIWDSQFCNEIATLTGHEFTITSCAFSKDGSKIVSGSADKTIKIWDAVTYKVISTLHGHNKPVIACAASSDDFIKIWDANTAVEILSIEATGYFITACTFSPDGKHILSGSNKKAAQIWDAKTGEKLFNLTLSPQEKPPLIWELINDIKLPKELFKPAADSINCCNYSPDGNYIVAGRFSNLIIFDAANGEEIAHIYGHKKDINFCAFSSDSKMIISGSDDNSTKVWDFATRKEIVSFDDHTSTVTSCDISPDGKHVISGSRDKTIKYWSMKSALETINFSAHPSKINICQFTPYGSLILTIDNDDNIKIWEPDNGSLITDISNDVCDFQFKGKSFKCKSWEHSGGQQILKLFDIKTDETLFILKSDFFAFSPDNKYFVAGHLEIHGYTDEYLIKINKIGASKPDYETWRSDSFITSYSYSPDGKTIATSNGHRPLSIHDAKTGKRIKSFHDLGKAIKCCCFSPNGQLIVTGNNERQNRTMYDELIKREQDISLAIWDIRYDTPIVSLIGHTGSILTCCFSPDGSLIASGSEDKTLKIWEVQTGKEISTFHAQSGVTCCNFHPNGTKLAFGCADGNLYLLNLAGFKLNAPILTAKFTIEEKNDALIEKTAVICPYCQSTVLCHIPVDATFDDSRLEIKCSECNRSLKINAFTIEYI